MNYNQIERTAEKLNRRAQNGTARINGGLYTFTFDHYYSHYIVEGPDFHQFFNTRKITEAEQWVKEWLNN